MKRSLPVCLMLPLIAACDGRPRADWPASSRRSSGRCIGSALGSTSNSSLCVCVGGGQHRRQAHEIQGAFRIRHAYSCRCCSVKGLACLYAWWPHCAATAQASVDSSRPLCLLPLLLLLLLPKSTPQGYGYFAAYAYACSHTGPHTPAAGVLRLPIPIDRDDTTAAAAAATIAIAAATTIAATAAASCPHKHLQP
jgi:hypothetical protein